MIAFATLLLLGALAVTVFALGSILGGHASWLSGPTLAIGLISAALNAITLAIRLRLRP